MRVFSTQELLERNLHFHFTLGCNILILMGSPNSIKQPRSQVYRITKLQISVSRTVSSNVPAGNIPGPQTRDRRKTQSPLQVPPSSAPTARPAADLPPLELVHEEEEMGLPSLLLFFSWYHPLTLEGKRRQRSSVRVPPLRKNGDRTSAVPPEHQLHSREGRGRGERSRLRLLVLPKPHSVVDLQP